MAKPTAQQCHALTTYFISAYKEVRGTTPVVNRNKAKWGFDSLLMDYTPQQSKELIDYFVKHYTKGLEWFLFNYEKVDAAKTEANEIALLRRARAKETQARLEKWREHWPQQKQKP